MRKTLLAVLALVFVMGVSASANVFFNGDFDFEDPSAGWQFNNASVLAPGAWSIPLNSGNFAAHVTSWAGNWSVASGTMQQTQYGLAAGAYDLSFDYYIGVRHSSAGRNGGIKVKLNGVEVFSEFVDSQPLFTGDFAWKSVVIPVAIADTADLVVEYHAHFAEWTWLGVDNVAMTQAVPEPGSILAMVTGLAGFGGMIIRRRK